MDQLIAFLEAAGRNRNRELQEMAINMRIAFNAQGKDWKQYLNTLTQKSQPAKKKQGMDRQQAAELRRLLEGR